MKKHIVLVTLTSLFCLVFNSCSNHTPEHPIEVNQKNILAEMIRYFPYSKDSSYTFVNNISGEELRLVPQLNVEGSGFPTVLSYSEQSEWENRVTAYFKTENAKNNGYTRFDMDIYTSGTNFGVYLGGRLVIDKITSCTGSIKQQMDTTTLSNFFVDVIEIPIKSYVVNKQSGEVPEGSMMCFVKDKGLTDFSIDGQSTWHLVEK